MKGNSGSEHFQGPPVTGILMSHVIPFFATAGMQRGSQQYVRLAADPALADASGMYFVRGKETNREAPRSPSTPPSSSASTTRLRHGPRRSCPAVSQPPAIHPKLDGDDMRYALLIYCHEDTPASRQRCRLRH